MAWGARDVVEDGRLYASHKPCHGADEGCRRAVPWRDGRKRTASERGSKGSWLVMIRPVEHNHAGSKSQMEGPSPFALGSMASRKESIDQAVREWERQQSGSGYHEIQGYDGVWGVAVGRGTAHAESASGQWNRTWYPWYR